MSKLKNLVLINLEVLRFLYDSFLVSLGLKPTKAIECDIYLNLTCNLRCSYCNTKRFLGSYIKEGLPKEQVLKIFKNITKNARICVILGGEALLRKDILEILRYSKENFKFLGIRLVTNGVLLKNNVAVLKYIDSLAISFDPTRLKEYPRIMEKMIKEVEELNRNKKLPFTYFNLTFSEKDSMEDLILLFIYFKRNNFKVYLNPVKYRTETYWGRVRRIYNKAVNILGEENVLNNPEIIKNLNHKYIQEQCRHLRSGQYYIDVNGKLMYPCDEFPNQVVSEGDATNSDLKELYKRGEREFGKYPCGKCKELGDKKCKDKGCDSYCHTENSILFRTPLRFLRQTFVEKHKSFFRMAMPT